jgi:hypothetical protein
MDGGEIGGEELFKGIGNDIDLEQLEKAKKTPKEEPTRARALANISEEEQKLPTEKTKAEKAEEKVEGKLSAPSGEHSQAQHLGREQAIEQLGPVEDKASQNAVDQRTEEVPVTEPESNGAESKDAQPKPTELKSVESEQTNASATPEVPATITNSEEQHDVEPTKSVAETPAEAQVEASKPLSEESTAKTPANTQVHEEKPEEKPVQAVEAESTKPVAAKTEEEVSKEVAQS